MLINTVAQLRKELELVFNSVSSNLMNISFTDKIIQNGIGFFPYGSGLLGFEKVNLPQNCVMILGQDFGTESYLTQKILDDGEVGNKTYNNLTKTIPTMDKANYFLTNLLIGLRKSDKMTGRNPVLDNTIDNKWYLDACFSFFEKQLLATNPKLIVVLGSVPIKAILQRYQCNTFISFKENSPETQNYTINANNKHYKIIAIPHPSMWHFNLNIESKSQIIKLIQKLSS